MVFLGNAPSLLLWLVLHWCTCVFSLTSAVLHPKMWLEVHSSQQHWTGLYCCALLSLCQCPVCLCFPTDYLPWSSHLTPQKGSLFGGHREDGAKLLVWCPVTGSNRHKVKHGRVPVAISRAGCSYSLSNAINLLFSSPLGLSSRGRQLLPCNRALQENPLLSVVFQSQPIPSGVFPFVSLSLHWPATHNQLHSCSGGFLLASEVTEYSLVYCGGAPDSLSLSSTTLCSDHTLQTTSNIYSLARVNSHVSLVFPLSPEAVELLAAQTGK